MNSFSKESTKCAVKWSLAIVFVFSISGCASIGQLARTDREGRQATESMLSAARENSISMFGELPPGKGGGYYSRAAVSMKQHTFAAEGGDFDADVDPEGKRMVFASTRHNLKPDLYLKSIRGVAVTQLTSDPSSDIQPVFSPDGRYVLFASDRTGNWDIWMIDVAGTQPVQITSGPADEVHPSWSTDGKQLVYCSLPPGGGQWELWITNAHVGSSHKFVGYGLFPEWSPRDDTILFQRARQRGSRWFSIWTITLMDGEPRYPTEVASSATRAMILPTWSKNGRRIAFATVTPGIAESLGDEVPSAIADIWIMDANGSSKIRLTDGYTANYAPAFSTDGRLFFTTRRTNHENVWSLLPSGGFGLPDQQEQLTSAPTDQTRTYRTLAETVIGPPETLDGD